MQKATEKHAGSVSIEIAAADAALKASEGAAHLLWEFKDDLQTISWACEQFWHHEFGYDSKDSNERLSRFSVAMLRMVAARSAVLHEAVVRDLMHGTENFRGNGAGWVSAFTQKVDQ